MSCDKINEPYLRDTNTGDTSGIDTVTFSSVLQSTRVVLIEEFTGHKCPNCPEASVIAYDLKEANPGKVVVVSIHAGDFAKPDGAGYFTYDFQTTDGTALVGFFQVSEFPNGLISRKEDALNKYLLLPQYWANKVESLKDQASMASIALNAYYYNNTVKCYIRTQFIGANSNKYKLVVILSEDSIIRAQKNNNTSVGTVPIIYNYVHKSVYRSSFNGTWGTALNSGPVADKQTFLSGYSIPIGSDWVAAHCNAVAYIYDKETLEILQVAEVRVQ